MSWATRAGGSDSELYRRRRDAETGCAAAVDAVITLSETMKAELVGRGLDPDRVFVVPHVVDTDRLLAAAAQPGAGPLLRDRRHKLTVGCVTSLNDYEGIETSSVRSLGHGNRPIRRAARRRRSGEGIARSACGQLGIAGDVVFTGRIDQTRAPDALRPARPVRCSHGPTSRSAVPITPLKPFEALAMGVPLIASDLPALAEVISASGGGGWSSRGPTGARGGDSRACG